MVRVELHVHKIFFTVKLHDNRLRYIMDIFNNHLTTYSVFWNKYKRRPMKNKDKEYFSYIPRLDEYRYPINVLRLFMNTLGTSNIQKENIDVTFKKDYNYSFLNLNWNKDYIPRDYQEQYVNELTKEKRKDLLLVDLATGGGKAQWVKSKVRVPNGWKEIGDMKVGDPIITQDGSTTYVTGVYPQGKKDLYEITFYDGRSTLCCTEHLWRIYSPSFSNKGKQDLNDESFWRVLNTEDIASVFNKKKQGLINNWSRMYISLPESEQNEEKEFLIHPYILGCIIGDGMIGEKSLRLTISSIEVIERIKSLLPDSVAIRMIDEYKKKNCYTISIIHKDNINGIRKHSNPFVVELRKYGLTGKTALNKFIPEEYLNGSTEQRWELLRGLMDTDGTVSDPEKTIGRTGKKSKCGNISYSTSSYQLCLNVIELIRSLGGIASYYIKIPFYTYLGERKQGNDNYVINVRLKHPNMAFTRPDRKSRLTYENQYSKVFKLAVKDIKLKMYDNAVCISVAHPSKLYVTENYIVTHNTFIAVKALQSINKRTAILVIPKYIEKWMDDVIKYTDIDKEDIYVVQGGESLMNLMLEEDISYKFIIFSMRTVSNYITDYEEGKMPYPIQPPDLMDHLGIGVLLNDEMHQHFHALTKAMLYFDVEQAIGLSATLVSNRKEIDKIYSLIVPYENRISNIIKPDKFRHVRSIKYTLEMNRRIQYKRAKGYNHILFEQSICRNSIALRDYINMICYYVEIGYIQRYQPGEKLLIFAASIKLCTILTERLKQRYPKLDVRRFVEDDPYENIINAEISVSSIGSAGTAIDIPGLITCINTISMSSLQANLQAIGRLRKIPDREVWYYYIWTKDIPNQYKMHLDRFNAIKHDIKEYVEDEYPYTIKTT